MGIINRLKKHEKLWLFIETTQKRIVASEMSTTSVVVAYYLLLSLFPMIIAFGNILPFLNIDPNTVLPYVQEIMPETVFEFIGPAIKDLLTQGSGGLLSISALAALWSASKSINALQIAMNKAYGVDPRQNFIVIRLVSIVVILLFMIAIVGVTVVLGLGKLILTSVQPLIDIPLDFIQTFQKLKWPLTLAVLLMILLVIYYIVPNAKLKIRAIVPGAIFATIGWMLLAQGFGIYAEYFASSISGYQIIGSFIVLMLWLNFAALIIVMGGIINAVVQEYVTGNNLVEREGIDSQIVQSVKKKIRKKEK
ncbi:MAG: YihY/virulence factor BrkB family protein [Enterococcus sp.]